MRVKPFALLDASRKYIYLIITQHEIILNQEQERFAEAEFVESMGRAEIGEPPVSELRFTGIHPAPSALE
jgi:hypothetical protein